MILGIGTDIVRVDRFAGWIDRPEMMRRFFGQIELDYCMKQGADAAASLAARFAAKEAFGKAVGCGLAGMRLRDIQVLREKGKQPSLNLEGKAQEAFAAICRTHGIESSETRLHLSLTHEREHAIAFVVFEQRPVLKEGGHGHG
jgi:holo-[acyl-carrier protein] synthase